MLGSKLTDMGHAVCHLTTDGVVVFELGIRQDMRFDVFHNAAKLVKWLSGLTIEIDITTEIETGNIFQALNDDGCSLSLTYKSQHLGMTWFTKDNNLLTMVGITVVFTFDAFLEVQHHRTSGIYDFNVILLCTMVGLGGFAMRTEQHRGIA